MPDIPPFHPPRLLDGPHLQTLCGYFFAGVKPLAGTCSRSVLLEDGDAIVLHEDRPAVQASDSPAVLLMHGLGGCHQSGYMIRVAEKLVARGYTTYRMDHRGSGAAIHAARLPYHAGLAADAVAAVDEIARINPESPVAIVGFSLSGNIVLKALATGTWRVRPPACAIAVNPPIDLDLGSQALARSQNRIYEQRFVKFLASQLATRLQFTPHAPRPDWKRLPKSLREFDDRYTARVWGFAGVADYYARSSAKSELHLVDIPTLLLTSRDDPLIPVSMFAEVPTEMIHLHIAQGGGHLGYIAGKTNDPDRRWMDWRIVDFLARQFPDSLDSAPRN